MCFQIQKMSDKQYVKKEKKHCLVCKKKTDNKKN